MSEPKAQLVDPQENMNLPGMNATGVITASSFSGEGGVVTGLTGSPNLNVGVVTATSFVGDGTGHAAGLTGTPNLNLGLTTATSFIGDAVGKAAGLTGTPNLNVGLVTATSFAGNVTGDVTGNITGLAASVTPGVNLNVGVCTAIQYHGNGANLTGAGSSAYIAQEVTASPNANSETIIDLSDGNLIYFDQTTKSTTVGFASTSPAEQITIIRNTGTVTPSFATGAVDFDDDDGLNGAADSDLSIGTGVFTFEAWIYLDDAPGTGSPGYGRVFQLDGPSGNSDAANFQVTIDPSTDALYAWAYDGSTVLAIQGSVDLKGAWHHIAVVRDASNTVTQYVDGVADGSQASVTQNFNPNSGSPRVRIGQYDTGGTNGVFNGKISNLRLLVGTALYTGSFDPPFFELSNITNTELLCCQSTSSTTTAAVGPTLTANSDPTASAQTITSASSVTPSITWPNTVRWNGGSAPTLLSTTNPRPNTSQIFRFTTGDTGASYQAWEEIKTDSSLVEIWQWGLITGNNNPGAANKSSPTQLPGTNWKALNGPFDNNGGNMVWTKTDGTLWAWGDAASYGALGLNDDTQYSSPIQVGTDTDWKQASAGYRYGVAVKTDGTLWSWGYGERGVLGLNNSGHSGIGQWRSSPTQVPGTNWTRVHGMGNQTSAFKTDGTLWYWGLDSAGSFAQNNQTDRSSPVQVPGTWDPDGQFKTERFTKKADGTWWGWGNNTFGQLGQNNRTQYSSPIQLPGTWAQIDASRNALGVKTDGTLWVWGSNAEGILGLNAPDNSSYSSPVQVGSGSDWSSNVGAVKSSAPTTGTSACIKTDGSLWMWGKNVLGSLGQNQAQPQVAALSSPTQVPGLYTEIQGVNQESYGVTSLRGV